MQRDIPDNLLTASTEDRNKRSFQQSLLPHFSSANSDKCESKKASVVVKLTPVRISTRVQWQEREPTLENSFWILRHLLYEGILHPKLRDYTTSRRHSYSNPRVPPHGSNSLHSSSRSRWIPQIEKTVKHLYLPTRPWLCNDLTAQQAVWDNDA